MLLLQQAVRLEGLLHLGSNLRWDRHLSEAAPPQQLQRLGARQAWVVVARLEVALEVEVRPPLSVVQALGGVQVEEVVSDPSPSKAAVHLAQLLLQVALAAAQRLAQEEVLDPLHPLLAGLEGAQHLGRLQVEVSVHLPLLVDLEDPRSEGLVAS